MTALGVDVEFGETVWRLAPFERKAHDEIVDALAFINFGDGLGIWGPAPPWRMLQRAYPRVSARILA